MKKYGKGGEMDSVAQNKKKMQSIQEKYESSMKTCVQGIWQWWDS